MTKFEPEKLVDEIAERVVELLGKAKPIKRIRSSQLISALLGAVGFALFTLGLDKLFEQYSPWTLIISGFILMLASGLLLRNLWR